MAKQIKGMVIREVSLVDKGANPGARISLYKRSADGADKVVVTKAVLQKKAADIVKDMYPNQVKIVASTFDQLYDDDLEEFYENWYEMLCVLQNSVDSITGDQELSADDKKKLLDQSLQEFHDAAVAELAVAKRSTNGDASMTADVEKMKTEIADLTAKLADVTKKFEAADAKLNKKGEKEGDACMLDGEEGKMEMDGGKLVCVTKREIEKRNQLPEHIQKKLDEQAVEIQKLRDKDELTEFAKRCETFKNLPVTSEAFAPILRKMAKALTADEMTEVERVLKAAHNAMAPLMKTHGSDHGGQGSALEQLNARATEIAKRDNVTKEKAFAKACDENKGLYDQYRSERKAK